MEKTKDKKLSLLLVCGLLGCMLMGSSDWIMIYGDPACEGALAWLTVGVGSMPAWRNLLAVALAFPAVVLYAVGLFAVGRFFREEQHRRQYIGLTALGLTPWLCLHLFYGMLFYIYSLFWGAGYSQEGCLLVEAAAGHFGWLIPVSDGFMVLPYLYLLVRALRKQTRFGRAMALNNPLLIFLVLKAVTLFMKPSAFYLGFLNGLMSEAMLIWFAVYLIALSRKK